MQYETLTDLLNNEAAAYDYFYALSPEMQTQLQQRRNGSYDLTVVVHDKNFCLFHIRILPLLV